MQLKFDPNFKVQKEDFGAVIDGDTLVLPSIILRACPNPAGKAVVVVASLWRDPTSWMAVLSWTQEEFEAARKKLFEMLEGRIDGRILHPQPSKNHSHISLDYYPEAKGLTAQDLKRSK